jgi:NAD(P)-dependent dehydrogenase (short-subunit alcohol dehydrogenase family)
VERSVSELLSLEGRVAIVTGSSRGLGREVAEALAEAGGKIVLSARREQELTRAVEELSDLGFEVIGQRGDISDPQQAEAIARVALERFGRLDVLVNNAGIAWGGPYEEMPLDRWRQVLETNVTGTHLMTRAALPFMKKQQNGKIINVASVAGLVGSPEDALEATGYSTSKGAVAAFTRDLAVKYARYGICVNAIAPGYFVTRMTEGVLARASERIKQLTPMARLGTASDLKGIVVLLASAASDYITGQVIAIDGGMTAM